MSYSSSVIEKKYKDMKKKLRILVFEEQCFKEEMQITHKKMLRVIRDRSYLLDRLLVYMRPELSSDEETHDIPESPIQVPVASQQQRKRGRPAGSGGNNQQPGVESIMKMIKKRLKKDKVVGKSRKRASKTSTHTSEATHEAPATELHRGSNFQTNDYGGDSSLHCEPSSSLATLENPDEDEKEGWSYDERKDGDEGDSDVTNDGYSLQTPTHSVISEPTSVPVMTREEVERHLDSRKLNAYSAVDHFSTTMPEEIFGDGESDYDGDYGIHYEP